ncbi:MAG TPA: dihydroorotase family protein [Candidatus Dormibacteraeota bacterium]|nr:dihydroorotase family protein [Candidatus Dormibacteraeota bacterium]
MTPFDLVVAGRIALPNAMPTAAELGIRDGRIAAIGEPGSLAGHERLEAGGALVLPGVVDAHVHTRSEPAEGVTRATTAAAAGGVTTVVDMPYDDPTPVTTAASFSRKVGDVEREAITEVALWATIARTGGLDEIEPLVAAGACGFKVSTFETHPVRFPRIPDGELYLAMLRVRDAGSLIAFHAENDEVVRRLTQDLEAQGRSDPAAHADSRPPVSETEPVGRALEFALATGARVHIVHATTGRSFTLVERARGDGVDATAETCLHYLLLDEEELRRQGARAKINPPLRPRHEVERLWDLLRTGRVDFITTDHVGWSRDRKDAGSIFAAKSGVPSLELFLPLLFHEAVHRRGLPASMVVRMLCENPARRLGLWPQKGSLSIGADADLVVFDAERRWRVDEARLVTPCGWSPYHGREVVGAVETVLIRGRAVFARGEVVGRPGQGCWVRARHDRQQGAPVLEYAPASQPSRV